MKNFPEILLSALIAVFVALMALPAGGAPIDGWQPWMKATGFAISYTDVPLNTDGTLKKPYSDGWDSLHLRGITWGDWSQIVGSPIINWSDRPLTDFGVTGVSYETEIKITNQRHVIPWFQIPDGATDDYWKQFGKLLAQKMDPSIPQIRIERSNEPWNLGDQKQGTALLLRARANPALAQYSDTERGAREFAIETVPKIDEIRAAYAAAGGKAELVYQVSGFAPNKYWAFWQLDQMQKMGRDPSKMDLRLSWANYVQGSPTDVAIDPNDSMAAGLVKLEKFMDVNKQWDLDNKSMADAFGLLGTDITEFRAGTSGGITTGALLDWWLRFEKSPQIRELQHYALTEVTDALGVDAGINLEGFGDIPYSQYGQFSLMDVPEIQAGTPSQSLLGVQDMIDFSNVPDPTPIALVWIAWAIYSVGRRGREAA